MTYPLLIKQVLCLMILSCFATACQQQSNRETADNDQLETLANTPNAEPTSVGQLIHWGSVKTEPLPFIYNYPIDSVSSVNGFFEYEKTPRLHQQINQLFSPLTPLNHYVFQNGHPSKDKGSFFKRLPDIGENKLVLFVYQDAEAQGQLPTIQLQVFDNKNQITDKMIVADAVNHEDCEWYRSFTYSKDTLLTLIDTDNCYNLDNEIKSPPRSITFLYKIKPTGKIVRYFKKAEAQITESLKAFGDKEFEGKYISKGKVKSHYKQGLWQEAELELQDLDYDKEFDLIKAFGYYKDGEKEGEWVYFTTDNISEYPDLAQRYKNGKLVEQTTELSEMNKYTLIKKLDSLRHK